MIRIRAAAAKLLYLGLRGIRVIAKGVDLGRMSDQNYGPESHYRLPSQAQNMGAALAIPIEHYHNRLQGRSGFDSLQKGYNVLRHEWNWRI